MVCELSPGMPKKMRMKTSGFHIWDTVKSDDEVKVQVMRAMDDNEGGIGALLQVSKGP